jgi:murein DD-endopeptidase MepM/ murein hydrolase activator NlpD
VKDGLQVGDKVARGDIVAYVGNSGCSTGPHIHFQVASVPRVNGASKYKVGELVNFEDCVYVVDPETRYCSNVP